MERDGILRARQAMALGSSVNLNSTVGSSLMSSVQNKKSSDNASSISARGVLYQGIAASLGAVITALVVTPLEVVKTRMQVVPSTPECLGRSVSTLTALKCIAQVEGPAGLWRGLAPSLSLAVPSNGIYLVAYEAIRDGLHDTLPDNNVGVAPFIAGSAARTIAAGSTLPLELIRTQMMASSSTVSTLEVARGIVSSGGVLGLWRGLSVTLLRDVPFSAVYWTAYESLKPNIASIVASGETSSSPGQSNFVVAFGAGAGAGGFAALITTPIDVVKTRIQTETHGGASRGLFKAASDVYRSEGARGFMLGVAPRVARVAPACAIMIGTYESVKKFFGVN